MDCVEADNTLHIVRHFLTSKVVHQKWFSEVNNVPFLVVLQVLHMTSFTQKIVPLVGCGVTFILVNMCASCILYTVVSQRRSVRWWRGSGEVFVTPGLHNDNPTLGP